MPAEEEREGRCISMAELSCGWIGSMRSREAWVDCGRRRRLRRRISLRARRREGDGVGFKQLDWIPNLAQSRGPVMAEPTE